MLSSSDLRFALARARGLLRRGLASLRSRGLRASWQRVLAQLRRQAAPPPAAPWLPQDDGTTLPALPAPPANPRASIVIPVFNQLPHTLQCLRALAAHPPAGCEIIVVDDASSDASAEVLPRIAGLRYHRRVANGGFIAACNEGAALVNGEFLVLLNNDTVPQPGWLDALLDTFTEHADVGLAGAQLLYPDGRLQEAGGVVFDDGHAWNYGRFEDPTDPRHAHVRDADYVSGAALALPLHLFRQLGGFDTRYAPAYYEDTDLAFRVREAGLRVLYQPASRVVHDEGTTSGTDAGSGIKAWQTRNREVFRRRWASALVTHLPPSATPVPALLHRHRPQVLVVDEHVPTPDRDSASLRLVNLMALLQDAGAHVVFVPARPAHAGDYTQALQAQGIEVWYPPQLGTPPRWLREHGPRFATVLLCRHHVAEHWLPAVRRHAPQARVVFDSIDLHYLREARGAELSGDVVARRAAQATRGRELAVIAAADVTLVVSAAERELLRSDAPHAQVELLSNLHRVSGPGKAFGERRDVLFVGGFRHPPNVDAVRWFVESVWPLVRAQAPELRFHCIGGDVPADIAGLTAQPGVHVYGHVADIAPYLDGCRIAIAPLRFGAGVKGKINLSMAHGQPVVATTIAAEGMHLVDGHDVLLADDAQAFAAQILRLHRDADLWQRMSANGLDNVQRHFSLDAARDTVRRVLLDPHPQSR